MPFCFGHMNVVSIKQFHLCHHLNHWLCTTEDQTFQHGVVQLEHLAAIFGNADDGNNLDDQVGLEHDDQWQEEWKILNRWHRGTELSEAGKGCKGDDEHPKPDDDVAEGAEL